MFQCGDRVVYGVHGVCNVSAIETQYVNRKRVEYYVLIPLNQPEDRFMVPTQNQVAVSKLRPLLTKEEIDALFSSNLPYDFVWISDEHKRKQKYRELVSIADRTNLIAMIRALRQHQIRQIESGRKFHMSDENFLRDAEKIICSEVAYVMGITQQDAIKYVEDML